jgi:hypothetical protein
MPLNLRSILYEKNKKKSVNSFTGDWKILPAARRAKALSKGD